MSKSHTIQLKPFVISLLISLGVGGLSALLTKDNMDIYKNLKQPALAPPSIVWTILFILMGISAYLIYVSDSYQKKNALIIYGVQLLINFLWPIIFFNYQNYLFSFVWLIFLWVIIIRMIIAFYKISKPAAYLQIPYLLWVTFAGYLNLAIFLLNK